MVGFLVLAVAGPGPWAAAVAGGLALVAMLIAHVPHSPAAATAVIVVLQSPHPAVFLPLLALATAVLVLFGLLPHRFGGHPVRYPATW